MFGSQILPVPVRKVQPTLQLPLEQPSIWHNDHGHISFVKDFTSIWAGRLRAPAPDQSFDFNRSAL